MAITLQTVAAMAAPTNTGATSLAGTGSEPNLSFAALFGDLMGSAANSLQLGALADKKLVLNEESMDATAALDPAAQALLADLGVQQSLTPVVLPVDAEASSDIAEEALASDSSLQSLMAGALPQVSQKMSSAADEVASAVGNPVAEAKVGAASVSESLPDMAANLAVAADEKSLAAISVNSKQEAAADFSSNMLNAVASSTRQLGQVQTPQTVAATPLTPSQFAIAEPVGGSRWADALGQKALFMVEQQVKSAEMHLNPPNLGPMEVKLVMDGDKASLSFVTSQAAVRDALQQSLPRLQQVMADNGMASLSVNVQLGQSQQFSQQAAQQNSGRQTGEARTDSAGIVQEVSLANTSTRWRNHQTYGSVRGVDVFA